MKYYITDVFANTKYAGNQLATILDYGKLSTEEMQQIAREFNFSETTFITSPDKENDGYNVRIFTPGAEIPFAGHPTLGTAYIIHKYIDKGNDNLIKLNTQVGQIPVNVINDIFWMTQNQPEYGKESALEPFANLLALDISDINSRFPIQEVSTGFPVTIIPLMNIQSLKKAKVNKEFYNSFLQETWGKVLMVFCLEGYENQQHLSTRVFGDYLGVPEDPATGSATGCLAAYLLKYKVFDTHNLELKIGQGYEFNRPSELLIQASLADDRYTLKIGGKVIEIAEGEMNI